MCNINQIVELLLAKHAPVWLIFVLLKLIVYLTIYVLLNSLQFIFFSYLFVLNCVFWAIFVLNK